jgi:hypothetical protein
MVLLAGIYGPKAYLRLARTFFYLTYLVEEAASNPAGGPAYANLRLEGRMLVKGWRSRFIFTLLVFFAGFATAVYTLAPAPEEKTTRQCSESGSPDSKFNSQKFVEDFNTGMHKCLEFGKKAALHTGRLLKEKAKELREA